MNYFWDNRGGFLIAFAALLAFCLLLNWLAWMFRWGRFAQTGVAPAPTQPLRFLVGKFFVEIINDFRHFLALVIVLLFAAALGAAMYPGLADGNIMDVTEGVEAVAAALGGLIGSIIGYYFGESAASQKTAQRPTSLSDAGTPVQQAPPDEEQVPGITPAPPLPGE
ncbi:MAG: hypothetical protein FJW14_09855 [Acidimicrobiia bacterium]|nr:hypothetical protein [Acidimicrobiia bacterium]